MPLSVPSLQSLSPACTVLQYSSCLLLLWQWCLDIEQIPFFCNVALHSNNIYAACRIEDKFHSAGWHIHRVNICSHIKYSWSQHFTVALSHSANQNRLFRIPQKYVLSTTGRVNMLNGIGGAQIQTVCLQWTVTTAGTLTKVSVGQWE